MNPCCVYFSLIVIIVLRLFKSVCLFVRHHQSLRSQRKRRKRRSQRLMAMTAEWRCTSEKKMIMRMASTNLILEKSVVFHSHNALDFTCPDSGKRISSLSAGGTQLCRSIPAAGSCRFLLGRGAELPEACLCGAGERLKRRRRTRWKQ